MEEGSTEFHNYSETQPQYCVQKVLMIFLVKEGWVPSSRTSLGLKNIFSLSIISTVFSKTIHSPEPPRLFYSKVTHLLSVEHSNDTFNSHTNVWHQPDSRCWKWWQIWNIDVRPLILTLRLLMIVPGTWNQYTAFGTSFMFPESGSWQLTRKCRCLFTAGKCNINSTHTSSNSYKSA